MGEKIAKPLVSRSIPNDFRPTAFTMAFYTIL